MRHNFLATLIACFFAVVAASDRVQAQSPAQMAEIDEIARVELDKYIENLNIFEKLSAKEQKIKQKESNAAAAIGLVKLRAGLFKDAASNFEKSIQLDPENMSIYNQYGLALLKADEPKKGLVYLIWSKTKEPQERVFNIGTAHQQLKQYGPASEYFAEAKSGPNAKFASLAGFFQGMMKFEQKQLDEAKAEFEFVMDNSTDPKLDAQAESYIEKIVRAQQSGGAAANKTFAFNLLAAAQYDSNILFTPDNVLDQGTALDAGGARLMVNTSLKGKLVRKAPHELSAAVSAFYLYSLDEQFRRADPFLASISLPYTHTGKMFEKNHRLQVTPGFESIYMDVNTDDSRENILGSIFIDVTSTTSMRDNWVSVYQLKLRSDDSKIAVADPRQESSAVKAQVFTQQSLVLDKATAKSVNGRFGVTVNSADGEDNNYMRLDLSFGYSRKIKWQELIWSNTLAGYNTDYSDRVDGRKDTNLGLSTTFIKPMSKGMMVLVTIGYNKNISNLDVNDYSKWTAMTALNFDRAF